METKTFVRTACGIEVKRWCASCQNKCVDAEEKRLCAFTGLKVKKTEVCRYWVMDSAFEKVGMNQGRIKRRAYLLYVEVVRREEDEGIEQGIFKEEDRKPVEVLRQEFIEKYGSIYE